MGRGEGDFGGPGRKVRDLVEKIRNDLERVETAPKLREVYIVVPKELKYSASHEWVKIEGKKVRIGITDYAQQQLGDVVFVDLPAVGEQFTAKSTMATIETITTVSDIIAPLSGEIIEVNDSLEHSPEWVNQDPYGKGWIAIIEPADPDELKDLLDASAYSALLGKK